MVRVAIPVLDAGSDSDQHKDNSIQILLIGKTGNGKSSLGNSILGKSGPAFKVSTGILSATTRTELGESVSGDNKTNGKVQVVDFPNVFDCDLDENDRKREADLCTALTFPFPTVVCLVVRGDVRFTPQEYDNYQKTKKLLERRVTDNMVVVFTMADRLDPEQRDHFDQQLQEANVQIQQVVQDARDRYVLVSNKDQHAGHDEGVSRLLDLAVALRDKQYSACKPLCAILLGTTGSGKSATVNSILFNTTQQPPFNEQTGLARPNASGSVKKTAMTMPGFQLEVLDTPGLQHEAEKEGHVRSWFQMSLPEVIIYVINASHHFTELNMAILDVVKKIVGREEEFHKRLIFVFTCGDKLRENHTEIDEKLANAPECLKTLLESAKNRYLLFDNKTKGDSQGLLLQRNRLLEMMEKVANANARTPLQVHDDHQSDRNDDLEVGKNSPGQPWRCTVS